MKFVLISRLRICVSDRRFLKLSKMDSKKLKYSDIVRSDYKTVILNPDTKLFRDIAVDHLQ